MGVLVTVSTIVVLSDGVGGAEDSYQIGYDDESITYHI